MGASGLKSRSKNRTPPSAPAHARQSRKARKKSGFGPIPLPQPGPDLHVNEIGPYRVLSVLGEGGMGAVFKARDERNGEIVAIKLLASRLANDAEFVERFDREAQIARGVRHPNVVRGLDSGWHAGRPFLVMEFVAGQSLDRVLDQRGVIEESLALRILRDVAKGLGCAHEQGVIHRDVKPDNVLLGHDRSIKLADFGLARAVLHARRLTRNGIALGTPDYIAPEQIECNPYADHRVDFYSLGAMFYRLLTGRAPYVAEKEQDVMIKHLYDPIPDPRAINPNVSRNSTLLVRKLMAKRAAHRYDSARTLLQDVEAVLAGHTPPHAAQQSRNSAERAKRRFAPVLGAICLAGLVFLLFALAKRLLGQ